MKQAIDIAMHQRDSSISTLGSGDWGSDIGTTGEDWSAAEDHSTCASDQGTRVRVVAEMAILASTSPEIKALSLRRGNSFSQIYHGTNMLPSPSSSVASRSSTISRANLSMASFFGEVDRSMEESKDHDDLDFTPTKSIQDTAEQLAGLSFESLRIEPPPSPIRQPDITRLIETDNNKENIPPLIGIFKAPKANSTGGSGSSQKPRKSFRSTLRDSFGSCSSSKKRPPKPSKSVVSTPKSPSRRQSMHRRVSFDSLPSPSEIGTPVPSLLSSSSSDRSMSFTCVSERSIISSSDQTAKTDHRRGASMLVIPRSLNLSKGYF